MPPSIPYSEHPGFAMHAPENRPDEAFFLEAVDTIDANFNALSKEHFTDLALFERAFSEKITAVIDKLEENFRARWPHKDIHPWVSESLKRTKVQLHAELLCENRSHSYQEIPLKKEEARTALRHLQDNGFVMFPISSETRARLLKICGKEVEKLKQMLKEEVPGERVAISLPMYGELGRILRKIVKDSEMEAIASNFRRYEMELEYCSIDYSNPTQSWYKNCYSDLGIPTSKSVTMHYDYEGTMLKAMIYLSPNVSTENGAFGFVKGSHAWKRSRFLFTLYKDMDNAHLTTFRPKGTGTYYRPRFKLPLERERFMRLPKCLQSTSHFGDDLLDDAPLQQFLLQQEVKLVGPDAGLLLFDGPRGIHRGSMVQTGERIAFQLGIRVKEDLPTAIRILRKVRRMAGRLRRFKNPF